MMSRENKGKANKKNKGISRGNDDERSVEEGDFSRLWNFFTNIQLCYTSIDLCVHV